jgi:single-stranded DNA-binding protein
MKTFRISSTSEDTPVNKAIISGEVSSYGPKISWTESGKPQTAFTLVLDKAGYKTFIPCLCVGTKAPEVAETINSGDLLLVEGSLSWKAGRGSQEAGKLQVVCFDVERLQDSTRTDHEASPAYGSGSDEAAFNHEAPSTPKTHKPRKPRYGKPRRQPWAPSGVMSEN